MKIKPSKLALDYLQHLEGIEIGGSAHNSFNLKTRNVDFVAGDSTVFKQHELNVCGETQAVDVVAAGDKLPFPDDSLDFVVSSHVIEHFYDPVAALKEWFRVTKPGGYIFLIVPHKERTFDRPKPLTSLQELMSRHEDKGERPKWESHEHYSIWDTESFLKLCRFLNYKIVEFQNVDDKVGNGFSVLLKKPGSLIGDETISKAYLLGRSFRMTTRKLRDFARTVKLKIERIREER